MSAPSAVPAATAGSERSTAESWWDGSDVRRTQTRTIRTLSVANLVGALGMGAAPTVGVLLTEQIMESEILAGIARTSMTLGAALAGIPLAALAARHGRRAALGGGWLVSGAGALALIAAAATAQPAVLIVGMLLIGTGTAVGLQARFAATDLAPPSRRGRSLAFVVWVGTAGIVLGANVGLPGEAIEAAFGLPLFSGGFVIAAASLLTAGAVMLLFLRPDPLRLARSRSDAPTGASSVRIAFGRRLVLALRSIWSTPPSRVAFVSVISANAVMVAVMTMTPVHLHHGGASISVVGITISLHVLGMFAFSPLVGMLADRIGAVPTIVVGFSILLISLLVSIVFSGSTAGIVTGLFLLGLGWSFATVAGSALLAGSIRGEEGTLVQGVADTTMNTVSAVAAALSGPVLAAFSFSGLGVGGILLLVPGSMMLAAALRRSASAPPPAPSRPTSHGSPES